VVPAVVFVAVVVATGVAAELGLNIDPGSGADTAFLVGALVLYGGAGFAIGQWRAIALTLVTVVVAVVVGGAEDDSDGVAAWVYTAIDTMFLFGPVMLAGIALRKVLSLVIHRRDASGDKGAASASAGGASP